MKKNIIILLIISFTLASTSAVYCTLFYQAVCENLDYHGKILYGNRFTSLYEAEYQLERHTRSGVCVKYTYVRTIK